MLPDWLKTVLPEDTATTWELVAPLLPKQLYLAGGTAIAVHLRHRTSRDLDFFFHGGVVGLDELKTALESIGPFATTELSPGTLNGLFSETRLQFLDADRVSPQRLLAEPEVICGLRVASLQDLMAMKLKVVGERAELRDYFDVMMIDRNGPSVEAGLTMFMTRYGVAEYDPAPGRIIRALAFFDDLEEDDSLPAAKSEIEQYWRKRQPEILKAAGRIVSL